MAEVRVEVGGHAYRLACRDGEEEALRAAARHLDARAQELVGSLGALTEARLLLMAGLQVCSELLERQPDPESDRLARLAEACEALAESLEAVAGLEARPEAS
ncbi:cell division protein ZapA [Thermaurantiacus sp.]